MKDSRIDIPHRSGREEYMVGTVQFKGRQETELEREEPVDDT